jgi:hypothetical protein
VVLIAMVASQFDFPLATLTRRQCHILCEQAFSKSKKEVAKRDKRGVRHFTRPNKCECLFLCAVLCCASMSVLAIPCAHCLRIRTLIVLNSCDELRYQLPACSAAFRLPLRESETSCGWRSARSTLTQRQFTNFPTIRNHAVKCVFAPAVIISYVYASTFSRYLILEPLTLES